MCQVGRYLLKLVNNLTSILLSQMPFSWKYVRVFLNYLSDLFDVFHTKIEPLVAKVFQYVCQLCDKI